MKKNQKILEMMSELDEKYIEEAEKASFLPQKNIWKRVTSIAASVALVAAICTFPIWGELDAPEVGSKINLENLEGKEFVWDSKTGVFTLKNYDYNLYANDAIPGGSGGNRSEAVTTEGWASLIVDIGGKNDVSEEIKATPNVLYPYITGDYASYTMAKGRLMEDKVGEKLCDVTMAGADGDTIAAELYAIDGVDIRCAVTVKYPKYPSYCIFLNSNVTFASFAEFKAAYSLDTELYMGVVMVEHIVADNSDQLMDLREIAPLKKKLLALDGASCSYEDFAARCDMKKSIGFDAEHGALWCSVGGGLQIFEDGFLVTNLGGGFHIFDIGKNAAKEIIADAKENQYVGVNFYDKAREILVDTTKEDVYTGALPDPEMSGAYVPDTSVENPYELTTPSYNPHESIGSTEIAEETIATETTTAAPPYMPQSTVVSPYATNPLIYEIPDTEIAVETAEIVRNYD